MQIIEQAKRYDVCIVGSGAGGGMAAKVLAEAGAEVVMLEAGPGWNVETDSTMFRWNYDSPRRGGGHRERPFGEFDACLGGWDIEGEPYTVAEGESESERKALLDDIAYSTPGPDPAQPEGGLADEPLRGVEHGRAFFNAFRDLTASGFWSSKMGVEDLGCQGNRYVAVWNGCPPEVLEKLGLTPR